MSAYLLFRTKNTYMKKLVKTKQSGTYQSNKHLILFIIIILLSGCGTIIHGSKQDVIIISTPKKAEVNIDGLNVGTTPFLTKLSRKNIHFVKLDIQGYETYYITLSRKLDAWIFGNIIIGGIIGIAVDAATGSMYKLSPGEISADLKVKSTVNLENKPKDGIYITVVLQPKDNWEKIGSMNKSKVDYPNSK